VARSGLKSVAQGLPWVTLPTRIALKGPRDTAIIGSERLNRIACAFPAPSAKRAGGLSTGVPTLSFLHHLSVGIPPRPTFLAPTFTHPLQSSFPLEAPLNGANGTQAGLCYINAVASSLQVHGDSSRDGSGRSLDSPEGQCSIGFQPVFCSHVEDVPRC
jgi:hypothetical protein